MTGEHERAGGPAPEGAERIFVGHVDGPPRVGGAEELVRQEPIVEYKRATPAGHPDRFFGARLLERLEEEQADDETRRLWVAQSRDELAGLAHTYPDAGALLVHELQSVPGGAGYRSDEGTGELIFGMTDDQYVALLRTHVENMQSNKERARPLVEATLTKFRPKIVDLVRQIGLEDDAEVIAGRLADTTIVYTDHYHAPPPFTDEPVGGSYSPASDPTVLNIDVSRLNEVDLEGDTLHELLHRAVLGPDHLEKWQNEATTQSIDLEMRGIDYRNPWQRGYIYDDELALLVEAEKGVPREYWLRDYFQVHDYQRHAGLPARHELRQRLAQEYGPDAPEEIDSLAGSDSATGVRLATEYVRKLNRQRGERR